MAPAPIVSVITPTFNHEKFITQCLDSVRAQTFDSWEQLVVDDGSTDRTVELVEARNDPRIRIIRRAHSGPSALSQAYNEALRLARGNVIAILEGDDYWPSDKLETQVQDFDNPAVVLSSGFTEIVSDEGPIGLAPATEPPAEYANNRPIGRSTIWMCDPDNLTFTFPVATMLRKDALERVGGFIQPEGLPLVDFPTFLALTLEGEFRFHKQTLGYWRRHPKSVTQSSLSKILEIAYGHAFAFIQVNREQIPASDEELDTLEEKWDRLSAMRCVLRGRLLSTQGQHKEANRAFKEAQAFTHAGRTRTIAGILATAAGLKIPVEAIYKLTGKGDLDTAITLDTGDRTVSVEDMSRPRTVGRWRKP